MVYLLPATKLANTCVQLESSDVMQATRVQPRSGENLIVQRICQDKMPGTFVIR
jgi:hypothetical protein